MDHSSRRLSYLDSSRGLAAFIVLITHFQGTILPQLSGEWFFRTPFKIFIDGQAAVLFFFILSGYVLTMSLKRNEALSWFGYLKFITRRIFRIYPAFIFTLLVTFIIIRFVTVRPHTWLERFWTTTPGIFALLKEALLIVRLPYDPFLRLIPQDWTLTIEIAISMILPALAITSRMNSLFVLFFVYFSSQFLGLDPFVFDFTLGVFLASNFEKATLLWQQTKFKIPLILLSIILICADYSTTVMKYTDIVLLHHKIWGLAILLWMIISSTQAQKILSVKPIAFLGKISYSFYLLHLILLFVMTVVFPALNTWAFLFVYLFVTIVVSTITFYIIERPFNQLAKSIFGSKVR